MALAESVVTRALASLSVSKQFTGFYGILQNLASFWPPYLTLYILLMVFFVLLGPPRRPYCFYLYVPFATGSLPRP